MFSAIAKRISREAIFGTIIQNALFKRVGDSIFSAMKIDKNPLGPDEIRLYRRCERFSLFYFPILLFFLYAFSIKQTGQTGDCPVAIDLNGNGRIDITGFTPTQEKLYTLFATGRFVEFDVWGDGGKQRIDWIAGGTDALIVEWDNEQPKSTITGLDLMGPIRVYEDGRDEMFADGYAKMASFDTNGDGELAGEEFKELALWVDDGDASLEDGEIRSFEDEKITSISVSRERVSSYYGFDALQSHATTTGGQVLTEDVWFLNEGAIPEHDLKIARALSFFGI